MPPTAQNVTNMRNVFFMTIWIYTFLGLLWGTVTFFGNSFLVITHAFFPFLGEKVWNKYMALLCRVL